MVFRPAYVRAFVAAVATLGLASVLACGDEAVGIESCRQIENARCENAFSCGIDLSKPVHRGESPGSDVAACKRYYEDACLHGLAAPEDPGAVVVKACVDAIYATTDCDVVRAPEKHPACAFLVPPAAPPPPPPDAATD